MTDAVKLPPMPEPYRKSGQQMSYDGYDKAHCHLFSIRQLNAYAIQAVMAERERCAKICEAERYTGYVPPEDGDAASYYDMAGENCADAIRAQPEPQP